MHRTANGKVNMVCRVCVCWYIYIERKLKSWSPSTLKKIHTFRAAAVSRSSYAQRSYYVCTQDDSTAPMSFFHAHSHSLPNDWNMASSFMVIWLHCRIHTQNVFDVRYFNFLWSRWIEISMNWNNVCSGSVLRGRQRVKSVVEIN